MSKKYEVNHSLPYIQIREQSIIMYSVFEHTHRRNTDGFKHETYSGVVTEGAAKRIRTAVDILLQITPHRTVKNPATGKSFKHWLSFITLTIPGNEQHVNVKFANKNLLAPWIRIMRKKHTMLTYVWKAEFQKNGQLHYHITTPSVIHHSFNKDTWNNILSSNGLLKQWMKQHNNTFLNSTDIHSVKRNDKFNWYLSKEISKANKNAHANGKVWDCSLNIKHSKMFSCMEPSTLNEKIDKTKIIETPHCYIYKIRSPVRLLPENERANYNTWKASIQAKGLY